VELSSPKWTLTVNHPEQLGHHRREQMLASVLLHVIEAALPVDVAVHFCQVRGAAST